jgi:hypothetical protein
MQLASFVKAPRGVRIGAGGEGSWGRGGPQALAATLRRHFNRVVGVPPNTYRRTFRTYGPKEAEAFVYSPSAAAF